MTTAMNMAAAGSPPCCTGAARLLASRPTASGTAAPATNQKDTSMTLRSFLTLPLVLAALASGAAATASAEDRSYVITDPTVGHDAFPRFLNDGNLDAIVDLYADDAVMVVAGGATVIGRDAIRAYFAEAMTDFDHVDMHTLWEVRHTDTAVFRSIYTLYFRTADGGLAEVTSSGIEVEQLQPDGTWLFIVDHHFGGVDEATYLAVTERHLD